MKTLFGTVLLLSLFLLLGSLAWLFPWARGAVEQNVPQTGGVPSYALREIRPGPLVPPTTMPTLIRATDATLRDWVPPT